MREILFTPPSQASIDPLAIDQREAAMVTGLSAKTLGRLADAGEPVGRVKIGRRVLYHRATLSTWLLSRAEGALLTTKPELPTPRENGEEVRHG